MPSKNELLEAATLSPSEVSPPLETSSLSPTLSLEDLEKSVEVESKKREVIKKFVQSQLIEGTDFMKLPFGQNTKSTILKPGAEKICSLFQLTSRYEKDSDTWEMLGSKAGTVCYVCQLFRGDTLISEGRGNATVGDKGRDANATVKIAEKRAKMDACLSLGFSDFFTQDLEDMEAPKTSAVARQEAREATEKIKDGEYTIFVEEVFAGTTKNGDPYLALKTELGKVMVWKELVDSFVKGATYDVKIVDGSVREVLEDTLF